MPHLPDIQTLDHAPVVASAFCSEVNYHLCTFLHPFHTVHGTRIRWAKNKYVQRACYWCVARYTRSCTHSACFCTAMWKGKYLEQLAKASGIQAGRWPCMLAGWLGVQGSHWLLVIAGVKQELWPTHANCLLHLPPAGRCPIHPATLTHPPAELGENN